MSEIGFEQNKSKTTSQPLVKENFTNAIAYGQTGSGKTSAFIMPNIENRIKLNHGLLIYDFKGNMHSQVKALARTHNRLDDIVEIGKPWGANINILDNANMAMLQNIFAQAYGKADKQDGEWQVRSANLFTSVCEVIQLQNRLSDYFDEFFKTTKTEQCSRIPNSTYSLYSVYTKTNTPQGVKHFIGTINEIIVYTKIFIQENIKKRKGKAVLLKMANMVEKLRKAFSKLDMYKKLDGSSDSASGVYATIQCVGMALSNMASVSYINKSEIDIASSLREGKIIIINLIDLDPATLNVINLYFYNALKSDILHHNALRPITIFIDEAHRVINKNYLPDVDICRENRFEYIFSTQDKLLLYSTIEKANTEMLLRNISEQYSFITNNDDNTTTLKPFEYLDLNSNKKQIADPVFFSDEERFEADYEYQKIKDVFKIVSASQLKKAKIKEKFILLNNINKDESDFIGIKTESNKIFQFEIEKTNYELLEHYKPKKENSVAGANKDYEKRIDNLEVLWHKLNLEIKKLKHEQ